MPKFIANWQLQGLTEQPLEAGMTIDLTDAEAEMFLEDGVLSRIESPDLGLADLTKPELIQLAAKDYGLKIDPRLGFEEVLALVEELGGKAKAEGEKEAKAGDETEPIELAMAPYRESQNKNTLSELALANLGLTLDPDAMKREEMEAAILAHLSEA
jgi:hypothetical protein